jgi:rare lipoprotein A
MLDRDNGRRAAGICAALCAPALLLAATALISSPILLSAPAAAKTPGKTYCFKGVCHRVKTIAETERLIGVRAVLSASYYDDCRRDRLNPCGLTSSGEVFNAGSSDNAASPVYPDGTKLLVWHPVTRRAAVVRVNNAGPYYGQRMLDLSRAAAERLGFAGQGVSTVHVKVLAAPTMAEATYQRHRKYAPVPGFIGLFQSIETALLGVGQAVGGIFTPPAYATADRPLPPPAAVGAETRVAALPAPREPRIAAAPLRPLQLLDLTPLAQLFAAAKPQQPVKRVAAKATPPVKVAAKAPPKAKNIASVRVAKQDGDAPRIAKAAALARAPIRDRGEDDDDAPRRLPRHAETDKPWTGASIHDNNHHVR